MLIAFKWVILITKVKLPIDYICQVAHNTIYLRGVMKVKPISYGLVILSFIVLKEVEKVNGVHKWSI